MEPASTSHNLSDFLYQELLWFHLFSTTARTDDVAIFKSQRIHFIIPFRHHATENSSSFPLLHISTTKSLENFNTRIQHAKSTAQHWTWNISLIMYNIHLPSEVWELTASLIPPESIWVMLGTFWVCTALCWQNTACRKHFLPHGKSREFSWPRIIHYSPEWSLDLPHVILGWFTSGFNWNFQISSLSLFWRLLTCFPITIPLLR